MKITRYLRYTTSRCSCILHKGRENVVAVEFAVTYKCNSKCKHCNIWRIYKTNPKLLSNELKLNEIKTLFTGSKYLKKLRMIGITGGEPFLREDIVDLLGFFVEYYPKVKVNIVTNGVFPELIENRLKCFIKKYKFPIENFSLTISLDGIGKVHDKIRGVPGNYQRVLKLIHSTKKLGIHNVCLSFTITQWNYHQLERVYRLSRRMKVGIGIQFAQKSAIYYGDNINKNFVFTERNLRYLHKVVRKIEAERNLHPISRIFDTNTYYLLNMVDFQRNPINVFKRYKCYAGTHICFIDPYGNVYPCIMLSKKLGNIRKNSFDKLWTSRRAQIIRSFIRKKKCMCWTPCMTLPSLYLNPLTIFWNISKLLKNLNKL